MIPPRKNDLVLAICLQTRGFAYVLFESWLAPVDWAVQDVRGPDKNTRCLERMEGILVLHTPDALVLQEMLGPESHRTLRIRTLNGAVAEMAERPEGTNHQWGKNPHGELSIDPVADERLVQATARVGAS
jgi:hypothetical protein